MTSLSRRSLMAGSVATGLAAFAGLRNARADGLPGVTATELKIGCTTSLSGPVSALGTIAKSQDAYFKMLNDLGGVAGRKINFIMYDDAFNPSKTVEQTRRLIESDNVAFLFSMLGTAPNSAVVKYINAQKVPHLFLSVNGDKWGDYKSYPWTMGFAPSSRTEAQVFAKHALNQKPDAKFALLYQNDDLGKDFVTGLRDVLGDRYDASVKAASYEVTEPTIDSQIVTLRATNADVLISGVTSKFAAQAIRKVHELGWKPMHYVTSGAASVASTITPVGPERAQGLITSVYTKDPADPAWADDPGVKDYMAFMAKYFPTGNPKESLNAYGYTSASVLRVLLEQCNGNFSRENIMAQANNLKDVEVPTLLPGVRVNTSPTNHHPLRQMQLQRFEGQGYKRIGSIIAGTML
ncbi:branched-chain amino acid ABC transporter substrate-binding protein [Rhodopseudomonas palustris]|uniref:Branched-chain amino acid ABC transporter substrate-binding protein n=1 Tax=Rhodopseudomonas palustris TaxID=1076 RepID=A0A323UL80_RHOPL|nr:ABC transporter substrate-binding protein [Rhodopseudomonas palustris]PZA12967.1 branched-chain amino acid ABC transporter substrate-binding protein [Rhodopseudomonas palustris]